MKDNRLVQLNPSDNVLVCCRLISTGECLYVGKDKIYFPIDIDMGHKIARQEISKGEKIIKYGVSIGSARKKIAKGEHVHLHNMKSDYIASHTRQCKLEEV